MGSDRRQTVAGRTLRYLDEGRGAPIVFVHAFPLHAGMWRPQLDALPDGWRALAPDLPGFHESPRLADQPVQHVRDQAAAVLDLVAAVVGTTPAVFVGLSMGGYVLFECWRQRPDRVRGLVFADTRAEPDTDDAQAKRRAMQARAREDGPDAIAEAMLPGLLGAQTQTTNPHLGTEVRALIRASSGEGIADALEALRTRPDSRPTLATITCPTLVIVGDEDTLTPRPMAETIADGITGATLVVIPKAGHLSNLEHPVAFNDALYGWLGQWGPGA